MYQLKNIIHNRLIFIILFLGVFLRLFRYLSNSSLWVDEAKLALNVVNSSFTELIGPLTNPPQFAPVGFVLATKALTILFYANELTLRFIPLFSGVFSLFLFFFLCKKILDDNELLIAILLFSISEYLINYSVEFKQYATEVLFTILVICAAQKIKTTNKVASYFLFGLIGTISLFFSYSIALILFSTNIYLIITLYLENKKWPSIAIIIFSFFWLLIFAEIYQFFVISLPSVIEGNYLFWKAGFISFPPTSVSDIRQYFDIIKEVFGDMPLKLFYPGIFFFVFLAGCIIGRRKIGNHYILLLAPILVTIIISIIGKYPFKGRQILFLTPFFIIFISIGIVYLTNIIKKDSKTIALLLIIVIFIQPITYQIYRIYKPKMGEEIKEVLSYYKNNYKHNDQLYVYYGAKEAFSFYYKKYEIQNNEYIIGRSFRDNWINYNQDINKFLGKNRVWFLFSHNCIWYGVDEEKYFIKYLDNIGKKIKNYNSYGASVYLYDLSFGS